jgi:hypothetical protein
LYHKELAGSTGEALSNMWSIVKGDAKKVEKKAEEVEGKAEKEVKAHT